MDKLPLEVQELLSNLQTQITSDKERIEAQDAVTQKLVNELQAKLETLKEEHKQELAAKDEEYQREAESLKEEH